MLQRIREPEVCGVCNEPLEDPVGLCLKHPLRHGPRQLNSGEPQNACTCDACEHARVTIQCAATLAAGIRQAAEHLLRLREDGGRY